MKTVKVGGEQYVYDPEQHNSILDCLEANNVEIMFHCREGFCGACRVKLVNGEANYFIDPLAFIDDDEILTCCCRPNTDLHIDIE